MRQVGRSVGDFSQRGFVVVPGVLGGADLAAARAEATAICRGEVGEIDGVVRSPSDEDDLTALSRYLCIHFPHKLSPLLLGFGRLPAVVDALADVIGPNVKMMQSMLFIKAPGKPGQAWHQDESHIPTRDRSLTAAWIALDDATRENGALWVIPGSHRNGVLWPMGPHDRDDEFDPGHEAHDFPFEESQAVSCEVPAGGVVFFSGYLPHRSFRNRSTGFRRALVNHYMSAESLLPWDWDGRLAATRDNRDIVLVRGEDPYAYKGTEDLTFPFLRPETPAQRHAAQKVF